MRRKTPVVLYKNEAIVSNEACKALGIPEAQLIKQVYLNWLKGFFDQSLEALQKEQAQEEAPNVEV